METRANYILIGAFTIAGFLGIMGFMLWFAQVELDRQFAYYDIRFSSVSGLGNASDVRFAGLPVGQVVDVKLSPDRDGTILVRIEVASETPVRTDSIATIEAQGVTGVSYVAIGPGTPEAPLLVPGPDGAPPEIEAGRSMLQSLSEDAPELVTETLRVVQNIGDLIDGDNQGRLERILINVENASEDFSQTLNDFSEVAQSVTDFADEIKSFNETLNALTGNLTEVLATADETIVSIGELSEQAKGLLTDGSGTIRAAQQTLSGADAYLTGDLAETTRALRQSAEELRIQTEAVSTDARTLMATLSGTGTTATDRLTEMRSTLEGVDALVANLDKVTSTVGGTATRIDGLIDEEGRPLLAETRALVADAKVAVASLKAVATVDLPAIIADVRAATTNAGTVIAEVGANVTASSARLDEVIGSAGTTLEAATESFRNANTTLTAINGALETGDRTLLAAERAFTGADRVINEDVSALIDSLSTTADSLTAAIGEVADDIPVIADDLRRASTAAAEAFAELRKMASGSGPAVSDFTTTALPLYTRLAQETRMLIDNLDALTSQIESNPTRFFLNRDTPEFRR